VHGCCGIWACIAAGIFGGKDVVVQTYGSFAIAGFSLVVMLVVFGLLKVVGLLRVSRQEEVEGLDVHEHGMPCYATDSAY
jgi:Amt family ammonium transporter